MMAGVSAGKEHTCSSLAPLVGPASFMEFILLIVLNEVNVLFK